MNNINVEVKLCTEDRARLDKSITLQEQIYALLLGKTTPAPSAEDDPLRKQLEQAVASVKADVKAPTEPTTAEPAEAPQDVTEAPTATDTPAEAETPAEAAPAPQEEPKVTHDDLLAKARALIYSDPDGKKGLKGKVKDICLAYAPQITAIPADKCDEVMTKLTALEG